MKVKILPAGVTRAILDPLESATYTVLSGPTHTPLGLLKPAATVTAEYAELRAAPDPTKSVKRFGLAAQMPDVSPHSITALLVFSEAPHLTQTVTEKGSAPDGSTGALPPVLSCGGAEPTAVAR
jgi:hypothetical protein